jgi:hypothetical protein
MLLSFLACSQIWLNLHLDHCQFGWITKLTKKHTAWGCSRQTALEDGQDIWRYNYLVIIFHLSHTHTKQCTSITGQTDRRCPFSTMPSTLLLLVLMSFGFVCLHLLWHALYFLWMDFHPCLYMYMNGHFLSFLLTSHQTCTVFVVPFWQDSWMNF